jgi:hypothetical protein
MAKRIKLELELKGFEELITKLDGLVENKLKPVLSEVLEDIGEEIGQRTYEAMDKSNLPAKGKYSTGDTIKTVVKNPKAIWSSSTCEINVGFDKTKPGAGFLLITGTPRMKPVRELEDVFVSQKFKNQVNKWIRESLSEAIYEAMKGG